jgi:hypothetical protein
LAEAALLCVRAFWMTNELAPDAASHEPTVRLRSCGRTLLIPADLTRTDQALAAWVMWPVLLEEGKTQGELAQKACRRVRIETAGSTRAIAAACLFFAEAAGMRHKQFWRSISDHLIAITVLFRAPVQSNRAKKSPQGCGAVVRPLRMLGAPRPIRNDPAGSLRNARHRERGFEPRDHA